MAMAANYDSASNDEEMKTKLDLLTERREQAMIREAKYKEKMVKYYNRRVHNSQFRVGNPVLRNSETSRAQSSGKLDPNWECPYKVVEVLSKGIYKLAFSNGKVYPALGI